MRVLRHKIQDEAAMVYQRRGELQARARVDQWLSPRMSVGAMLGTGLVDRNDTIVVLSMGLHLRAFGGER